MTREIKITVEEYDRLLKSELKLECLENQGVDNWDGFDDAMNEYRRLSKEMDDD
jgi:hypothetical protein